AKRQQQERIVSTHEPDGKRDRPPRRSADGGDLDLLGLIERFVERLRGHPRLPPVRRPILAAMTNPQGGIFALGTASHAYLEFDRLNGVDGPGFASAVASLREPRTTMGGVNLVAGFRPELWRDVSPEDAPDGVTGFNEDLAGQDGFVMPATQHDAVL